MDRGVNPRLILRVDLRVPPVAGGFHRCQRVTVGVLQRLVPQHMIGQQIPVPDRIPGRSDRQPVTFLGLAWVDGIFEAHAMASIADYQRRCSDCRCDRRRRGADLLLLQGCAQAHDFGLQLLTSKTFQICPQ